MRIVVRQRTFSERTFGNAKPTGMLNYLSIFFYNLYLRRTGLKWVAGVTGWISENATESRHWKPNSFSEIRFNSISSLLRGVINMPPTCKFLIIIINFECPGFKFHFFFSKFSFLLRSRKIRIFLANISKEKIIASLLETRVGPEGGSQANPRSNNKFDVNYDFFLPFPDYVFFFFCIFDCSRF